MESYTKYNNEQEFDWNSFLNKPDITSQEWLAAKVKAQNWVTCACGHQCSIIPRDSMGEPQDKILSTLGADSGFYGAIRNEDAELAKHFLQLIEIRSAQLIKEELINIEKKKLQKIQDLEKTIVYAENDIETYKERIQEIKIDIKLWNKTLKELKKEINQ